MATTHNDTEAAVAAGVATPVTSADEYKELIAAETARPGFAVTADHGDTDVGWTAQSSWSAPEPQNLPGQLFTADQLPDPRVAASVGLPPMIVPEHLITDEDDNPQGPEPWETGRDPREVREAIRQRTVSDYGNRAKELEDAKSAADRPAKKAAPARQASGSASSS